MRIAIAAAVACLSIVGATATAQVHAAVRKHTEIPAEPLDLALRTLAKDRGFQVVYLTEDVRVLQTRGAVGDFTVDEALRKLLSDSRLEYKFVDANTVSIFLKTSPTSALEERDGASASGRNEDFSADSPKSSSEQRLRLAQVAQGTTTQPSTVERSSTVYRDSKDTALTEIVVTAQKRDQRLQDVPVPVTALSADTLLENNELRLQDYYTSVPGLSVTPADFRGDAILTIRGITTGGGFTNPTVGTVIDDVPYGSSTGLGGGASAVDLDPSELSRIEVLRGPQGTLYGASSIGGLLKYVTLDPSTDGVTGHIQAGTSEVFNGVQLGYNVRGAINLPLSDTLAIRASAFARRDPGYIDNVESGQRAVNEVDVDGGRVSALWRPSDTISLKLSALLQETRAYGSPDVDPSLGDLKQSAVRGTGTYDKNTQAYSAIVKAKLGTFDITSLSGYSINKVKDAVDYSYFYGTSVGFGVTGAPLTDDFKTTKYSEELRFSTPIGQKLDWLFGVFYTYEKTPYVETIEAAVPSTGEIVGTFENSDSYPTTYQEYAAFTDLTFHLSDRFDVQVGGRESENRETYMETIVGIIDPTFFLEPSPVVNPEEVTRSNSFTYLVTPSFKVSPDLMVYGRFASGYRPGGPNPTAVLFDLPSRFGPDTTHNYEIGAKGDAFGNKLLFDASVYYIDWSDIQLQLQQPSSGATYYVNASKAKSQGIELSGESRPLTGMKLAAWFAWNDAVLTKGFPPDSAAFGAPGDRLPYSSRFSGNISFDQNFPLANRLDGFVGASAIYVGNRESVFVSPLLQRQVLPAYTQVNLRAGLKHESWSTNLFLNNLADRRGVLSGGVGGQVNPLDFVYIQPRTIGLSIDKTF